MKKVYKFAAIVTPITIMVGSLAVYLAISLQGNSTQVQPIKESYNNSTKVEHKVDDGSIYDKYEVFPDLRQEDFYDKVKVIKGKGIIDEEMVSRILNYIFDHMEVAEGDIGWAVKRLSDTAVIISVKWDSPDKVYSKNYKIDLKNV